MKSLAETFRRLEDPRAWRQLAPGLTIDDGLAWGGASAGRFDEAHVRDSREGLADAGFARLDGVCSGSEAAALAGAITAIRVQGLHPAFVYLFDEPWLLLGRILRLLSCVLQSDVEPLQDVWAWHVDPRVDAGGWPYHRGWYEDVRGADGLPDLVNVWLSLTRATPGNACIHAVPLRDDPGWPADLNRRPFDLSATRPLPTEPGSLLAWNANVLHAGGRCDPASRDGPRISASFTLRRRGWRGADDSVVPAVLPFRARLDLIAVMMGTYGEHDLPLEAPVMQWASATLAMRHLAERHRSAPRC